MSSASDDGTDGATLDQYLAETETVERAARGDARLFAVTDRRVLEVTESQTADGRPVEEVQTTLFTDVARVDLFMQGSTTKTDWGRVILGVVVALVGLLIGGAATQVDAGDATNLAFLVALVLLGIAAWILLNASERLPGGIRIELKHKTPSDTVTDQYRLPENQQETARAVVKSVGHAHDPET